MFVGKTSDVFFFEGKFLVGGLEHEFSDFSFSWECHHPN